MTNLTPPSELRRLWAQQAQRLDPHDPVAWMEHVSTQAAKWGSDQELEACCEYIAGPGKWFAAPQFRLAELRAARRPKTPSLKDEALKAFRSIERGLGRPEDTETIRRALEALDG